jgi:hypothetical protein
LFYHFTTFNGTTNVTFDLENNPYLVTIARTRCTKNIWENFGNNSTVEHRILTPIGRITVAKTLIIPKLNHLFISLPNPSQETISNLTKQ